MNKYAKAIVLLSGGVASGICAAEALKKYGKENVVLLNHDISEEVEDKDIKRYKLDISNYCDVPITYANMTDWETMTPLEVCKKAGAFQVNAGQALCTHRLKTEPFHKWLKENYPAKEGKTREDIILIYGFDLKEKHRIQRRSSILGAMGYRTDYPLAFWERSIKTTEEIGIHRPRTYGIYKHANCQGCLKAGRQHWYIIFCLRPDIWEKAKQAENEIGYSIIKDVYLEELEKKF